MITGTSVTGRQLKAHTARKHRDPPLQQVRPPASFERAMETYRAGLERQAAEELRLNRTAIGMPVGLPREDRDILLGPDGRPVS